ncbi:hypothetical protein BCT21_11600 [Vibrio sp. 10N.222.55.F9]|uniref:hypothetical protein n=1 Tax=Vibrio sp. 10N.222.55.F9 TaxID=1884471 RepID=UPI000C84F8E5|nr:hypothetical protein [Vibrio sp. 10N.222.55.F9]PMN99608.1 hypothetical protein BCT21_11600 [Vibrio sp. 10N.222.55.F9]
MNQARLNNALNELGAEYNVSSNELLKVLQSEAEQWIPIDGCPKYDKHKETGVIRNRSTHRVLKPNNSGFVKVRNYKGDVLAMKQAK